MDNFASRPKSEPSPLVTYLIGVFFVWLAFHLHGGGHWTSGFSSIWGG